MSMQTGASSGPYSGEEPTRARKKMPRGRPFLKGDDPRRKMTKPKVPLTPADLAARVFGNAKVQRALVKMAERGELQAQTLNMLAQHYPSAPPRPPERRRSQVERLKQMPKESRRIIASACRLALGREDEARRDVEAASLSAWDVMLAFADYLGRGKAESANRVPQAP